MSDGLLFPMPALEAEYTPRNLNWAEFHRKGPILRPARSPQGDDGVYGLDLTAGCAHGCPFCHIRAAAWFPGENRVLFDPSLVRRFKWTLDALPKPPKLVVLSPTSDPFPPHREVRAQAHRIIETLLGRGVEVLVMTRGRIPLALIPLLVEHKPQIRVAVALTTMNKELSRVLEPAATPPRVRLRGIARLLDAGAQVDVRLEPLIAGLSDTRENLIPLFEDLERIGVRKVLAHYLFLHSAMLASLRNALGPLGLSEKLGDDYEGGPMFSLGTLGPTRHLPLDVRREGLARLSAWGAEHGLIIETGTAQNPDLPRSEHSAHTFSQSSTGGAFLRRRAGAPVTKPDAVPHPV